jgi:hypothetical protein
MARGKPVKPSEAKAHDRELQKRTKTIGKAKGKKKKAK